MLLKIGSKGCDVQALQRLLGLEDDGIFGKNTEAAVKKWQTAHGLVADGIVGDKTWQSLTSSSKQIDPRVIYKPISTHITLSPKREIKYIAIHYTAGSSSKSGNALNTRRVFLSNSASADFIVDDKDIIQINPDINNYYCWAVGDKKYSGSKGGSLYNKATNKNTISIEICSNLKSGTSYTIPNHEGWYFTEDSLTNATNLVKILMSKYKIPLTNVVRHYDISGKCCPGIIGWNNERKYTTGGAITNDRSNSSSWDDFISRLA